MTIRHLKIFIAVVDYGSMSAAASKLYISQPTVSQAIAELEHHYSIRLFERLSQKLYITDDGQKLLSFARHITDSFDNMEIAMYNERKASRIRIGCSVSVGTYLINNIINDFEKNAQGYEINVMINNTSAIEEMVLKSEVDLGFVEGITESDELVLSPFCVDSLVLVCGKNHRLAQKRKISFTELEGENFISREKGSYERNQLEMLIRDKGIRIKRSWSSTNTESIKNAVICGRGLAVMPSMLIKNECQNGDLITLNIDGLPIKRNINMIYHKNKFITEGLRLMMNSALNLEYH